MSSLRPIAIAGSALTLVVMTACGGSTTPSGTSTPPAKAPAAKPSAAAPAAPTGPATIQLAKTTDFGQVLSDDQGRILYMFTKDKDGKTVCYDQCEAAWPPVLTKGDPVAGTGADKGLLGTTPRKDGTTQVTYKKMPLYRFTPDKKPGDVNGQAVKNIWWVVAPHGQVVGPATVNVGASKAGKVLTDERNFTLYMFTKDKAGKSVCYAQCEAAWPPLLTTGKPKAGPGADASKLGTTKRTDGTLQVTYNKLPLYYFTPDKDAGELKGQGVKNVWWLVSATGSPLKTKA
jgi:predicted lipoprotein with Yx(FWY)xxD motif